MATGRLVIDVDFDPNGETEEAKKKIREVARAIRRLKRDEKDRAEVLALMAKRQADVGASIADLNKNKIVPLTKAAEKIKPKFVEAGKGLLLFKKQGEVLQGSLGGLVSRVGNVGESLALLGPHGVAVGALVIGMAVSTAAIVGTQYALAQMVLTADDAIDRLRAAGREVPIDPSAVRTIEEASEAWTQIGLTLDAIHVILASAIGPIFRDWSRDVLAVSLRFQEFFTHWSEFGSFTRAFNPFRDMRTESEALLVAAEEHARVTAKAADEAKRLSDNLDLALGSQQELADLISGAMERGTRAQAKNEADAAHATQLRIDRHRELYADTQALIDAELEGLREIDVQGAEAHGRRLERIAEEQAVRDAAAAAAAAVEDEIVRQDQERAEQRKAFEQDVAFASIDAALQVANTVGPLLLKDAKDRKLLALFTATIETAAGVAKAIPDIPLMIAAGAAGAAQIATIAATPIPNFPMGGLAADHSLVGVQGGEFIVNPTSSDRFRSELQDINAGRAPGGGVQAVEVRLGHRWFDATVEQSTARPGSPLSKAIRGSRRVGHRERRNNG